MAGFIDLPFALVSPGHVWTAAVILPLVCTILVALRFYVRLLKKHTVGLDDWMSAVALILVAGMGACLIIGVVQRVMGYPTILPDGVDSRHAYQLALDNYEKLAKIEFYYQLIMIVAYGCIKLSLVLFYRRIFAVARWSIFDIACLLYIVLIIMWTLSFFLLFLFGCKTRIDLHWAPLSEVKRHCIDPLSPETALVVSDLIMDVMVLALPMPMIWRLQRKWTQKLAISLVFLVGLIAIAASIARMVIYIIVTRTNLDAGYDLDRTVTTMLWWSMIEACLGLMASCLPVLSGLVRKLMVHNWIDGLWSRLTGYGSKSELGDPEQYVDQLQVDKETELHRRSGVEKDDAKPGTNLVTRERV